MLAIDSGGIKGAWGHGGICPPVGGPLSPSRKKIMAKISNFWHFLFFFIFAPSETHFTPSIPPQKKKKKKSGVATGNKIARYFPVIFILRENTRHFYIKIVKATAWNFKFP